MQPLRSRWVQRTALAAALVAAVSGAVWGKVGRRSTLVLQTTTNAMGQPIVFPP